jgi:GNAT superfamily N-acetyltransferase
MDHHAIPPSSSPPPADRTTADDIGGIDRPRAATAQQRIRPVVPGDADGVRVLHTTASNQSLYLRFFGYSRTAVEEYLTVLSRPGRRTHQALTARVGSRLVGIAAFERLTGDTAEVALLVADDHHERGIGTLLMEHLAQAVRNNGIRRFLGRRARRERPRAAHGA